MNLFLFVALLLEGVSALQPTTGVWRPQVQMTRSRPAVCQKRDASGYLAEDELGDWTELAKSTSLGASGTTKMPPATVSLIDKLRTDASSVDFEEVISAIEEGFDVSEVTFTVGEQINEAGTNMGSAKILSLGKLTGLSETETLNLFGRFYRQDVLENPEGTDHANIRNLIKGGWGCVDFPNGLAINPKLAEFSTSTSAVEEALAKSSSISGDSEWDPDSDIWIP